MRQSIFYKVLENPRVYRIIQHVMAPGHDGMLKEQFDHIFDASKGLVLDVGCGPLLNTPQPMGQVIGIDINPDYVSKYNRPPDCMGIVSSADSLPFKDNCFNESRTFALLHHLPREVAVMTVREMIRCTKPDSRVIILDSIWPRNAVKRPLAWLSRRMDRGKWVRHQEELLELLNEAHPGPWKAHRFTYTYIGQEAAAFEIRKPK